MALFFFRHPSHHWRPTKGAKVSETPFGPPYLQQSETLAECELWVTKAGFPKGTGQPKEMHVGADEKTRCNQLGSKRGDDEGIVRYFFFPCRSIPKVGSKAEVQGPGNGQVTLSFLLQGLFPQ